MGKQPHFKTLFICFFILAFSIPCFAKDKIKLSDLKVENKNGVDFYFNSNAALNGYYQITFIDGNVSAEGQYVKGLRDGLHKFYYEKTGELWQEINYKKGRLHGLYEMRTRKGSLMTHATYIDGKPDGTAKSYYANGLLSSMDSFKNGVRQGITSVYYETGGLMREVIYRNGEEISNKFYEKK